MSIRSRILLSLVGVVALYSVGIHVIQQQAVLPSFQALEIEQARRNVARVSEAIGKDIDSLDSFCHDWAAWDDTFEFVTDGNADYVHANLERATFENGNFDLVWICDLSGRVVFGECHDPEADLAALELPGFPTTSWPADHPLLANLDPEQSVAGLVETPRAPLLVASRPIVNSLKDQSPRGWLVMGRFLTGSHVAQLRGQTRVSFDLLPLQPDSRPADPVGAGLPPEDREALAAMDGGDAAPAIERSDDLLQVYSELTDVRGHPALLVRADIPRSVTARGRDALDFALLSMLAAAVLLLGVLLLMLRHTILNPLATLTAHALSVGRSGNLSTRLDSRRRDELGLLAREFDGMVGKLAATREELMDRARLDGKAEVATSVLHNVGNVLNSVNVSTSTALAQLDRGSLGDAARLAQTLERQEADLARFITEDPRGRSLPAYLVAFSRSLVDERERLLSELRSLETGVDHIRALVDSQQAHAGGGRNFELVELRAQVETALRLSPGLAGAPTVAVACEFDELPALSLQRHKLLEILVNLIRNARQALRDAGTEAPRLLLRARRDGDTVRLEVSDNGPGIAPENLSRIFAQGFTTRRDGHGFGLHSAANAARELGGDLSVRSDGPGTGATFTLVLPLIQNREAA